MMVHSDVYAHRNKQLMHIIMYAYLYIMVNAIMNNNSTYEVGL